MSDSVRIHNSVFDAASLGTRISQKWGWQRVTCEFWSRAVNDTYLINKVDCRAFLRVSRRHWRARREIQSEVAILRFLKSRGVNVVYPIRKRDGSFIDQIEAPEGRRYAVLFSDAGDIPQTGRDCSTEFGRLSGLVHKLTDDYPKRLFRSRLDLNHLTAEPLKHVSSLFSHHPRDIAYLKRVAENLAETVASLLPTTAPEWGLCHGDLHTSNLHRNNDGRLTLFDFDCFGFGWRAYDISTFLWSRGWEFNRGARAKRTRQWNNFLEGYQSVRNLSTIELQAVKVFVPLRHIWVMGLNANLQTVFGRRTFDDSVFRGYLDFIKTWLSIYKPL